ncbi:MAG: PilZ domain-containing protein [Candidatus Omnitrophica bacterium]|nr:PilZ domain-containing protein [Candidatus Omnitrophota bacterium]MCA9426519.1 PilZ domain-containing protein [Candidatus Omnitrophota bacterium]
MTESQKPSVERRAHRRARENILVSVQDEDQSISVATRDVCPNGLSCVLPKPLSLFTKYRFALSVPASDGHLNEIDGEGIVVRVEEVEVDGEMQFETAFYFQHLDDGHQLVLEEFVQESDSCQ